MGNAGVPPQPRDVAIAGDTIPLGALLKLARAVASGGEAKRIIQAGHVQVNGTPEARRHRRLRAGDTVRLPDGRTYRVVAREGGQP